MEVRRFSARFDGRNSTSIIHTGEVVEQGLFYRILGVVQLAKTADRLTQGGLWLGSAQDRQVLLVFCIGNKIERRQPGRAENAAWRC